MATSGGKITDRVTPFKVTQAKKGGCPAEKLPDMSEGAFQLYQRAIKFQSMGCTEEAHKFFSMLVPYMGTDPNLWMRIAECCVQTLYKEYHVFEDFKMVRLDEYQKDKPNLVAVHLGADQLSDEKVKSLEAVGISHLHADLAVTTCLHLLRETKDVLRYMSAHALAAFIDLKRGRLRPAAEHADTVLQSPESPRNLQVKVLLVKIEIHLRRSEYPQAGVLCDDLLGNGAINLTEDALHASWAQKCIAMFCYKGTEPNAIDLFKACYTRFPYRDVAALGAIIFKYAGQWENYVKYFQATFDVTQVNASSMSVHVSPNGKELQRRHQRGMPAPGIDDLEVIKRNNDEDTDPMEFADEDVTSADAADVGLLLTTFP